MNANTAKALVLDAYYQVVDNKIFRLLLVLEALVIVSFLCIGFGKDEVRIFWGLWTVSYESLFALRGEHFGPGADLQGIAVQGVQRFVVEGLCGNIGMVVCLSATSFFLPRMLEKGAADIVFSKPVSRFALMFSRYVSGLLFVGILAGLGVTGVWIAFLVGSGYNDPGVLWGAVTLVYLFAILHAVSIFVGVTTRSTVAAILISILFFAGNGCIHQAWFIRTYIHEAELDATRDTDDPSTPIEIVREEPTGIVRVLLVTLDVLHYALPKTSDADVLTQKLRKSVEGEAWKLVDVAGVTIPHPPPGLEVMQPANGVKDVDLAAAPVVFESPDHASRIEISRHAREIERIDPSGKNAPRKRSLSAAQAADEVVSRVRAAGRATGDVRSERSSDALDGRTTYVVAWKESGRSYRTYVAPFDNHVLEIAISTDPSVASGPRQGVTISTNGASFENAAFLRGIAIGRDGGIPSPAEWYARRFTWTGPLSSNIGYSIASSLLFVASVLARAWMKLRKIDF
jgi:hypothetical protein